MEKCEGKPEKKHNKCKFTPEEDKKLISIVDKLGPRKWKLIATFIEGRTARQCRDRYANYLRPNLNFDRWTPEEDSLLIQQYYKFGPKWSKICTMFKGRSSSSLKNRWHSYLADKLKIPQRKNEPRRKYLPMDANRMMINPQINGFNMSVNGTVNRFKPNQMPLIYQTPNMEFNPTKNVINNGNGAKNTQPIPSTIVPRLEKSNGNNEIAKYDTNPSNEIEKNEIGSEIINWDKELMLYFEE